MGLFDTRLGALLIGVFFNTYLYGIVTYQYAAYHNTKFDDPLWIKLMVFSLSLLDTFHSASVIYMAWHYSVENFLNPYALLDPVWPYPFTVIVTSITAFLAQNFLGYRVFRLTKSNALYGIIIFLSVASLVVGVVCGVFVWRVTLLSQVAGIKPIVTAWLCLEVGVDALVTTILACVLSQSRTGFRNSDTVINRLIRASIQTGLFAGIFSILSLVFFLRSPGTHFFGMFGIPISRVYTNTLMDTLLARHTLRGLFNGTCDSKSNRKDTDAIWMIHDAPTMSHKSLAQHANSIQLQIRKDIYTDTRLDDEPKSPIESSQKRPDSSELVRPRTNEVKFRV